MGKEFDHREGGRSIPENGIEVGGIQFHGVVNGANTAARDFSENGARPNRKGRELIQVHEKQADEQNQGNRRRHGNRSVKEEGRSFSGNETGLS